MNNIINHIYCINLAKSKDRKKLMKKEFKKHSLDVEFWKAFDGDKLKKGEILPQYRALNKSIIDLLKDAIINKYESIMILEDDVVFAPDVSNVFSESFNDVPDKWNVLYLGILSTLASPKVKGNIHRIKCGVYGHAFCLNMIDKDFIDSLIKRLEKMDLPSDLCLAECYKDLDKAFAFAILPSIAKQTAGYSTILKTVVSEKDYS